ncbi:hypothetical protein DRQ33_01865 [bacterium]|nr:MAG: hypothetical protein DRQ33_01865 [bacterium]
MKNIIIISVLLCCVIGANPLDKSYDPAFPRPTAAEIGLFDVVDYSIFIPIKEPYEQLDSARVFIIFTNSEEVDEPLILDFEGMTCDSVIYTHPILDIYHICDFEHRGDTLFVHLPWTSPAGDTFFLTIYYHGTPEWGYFVENNRYGDTVIYSLSWPSNARCWFPCIDHPKDKATATINILAPSEFAVASNGVRLYADTLDEFVIHTWRSDNPICTYNICFAAGDYIIWSDTTGSGVPLIFYAYPEDSISASFDWGRTAEITDSFQNYFGQFPLEKYGTITTPFGLGGMEHQSMTFLGDGLVTGGRHYESVVAHELAHSWFGNSVGLADWRDFWLNEGFAVFSEFIYNEIFFGDEVAKDYRRNTQNSYFSSGENFSMFDPEEYLSYTCYNRAGCVIQMLRFIMGDSLFFSAVREYTYRFRYKTVTNDSFRIVMEEFWGDSLDWFFEQWVFQAGYPRFEYWYECNYQDTSYLAHLNISQNNIYGGPEVYTMPLEIKLELDDYDLWDTVWVNSIQHDFYWDVADSVERIRIDPNYHSLRRAVVVSDIDEMVDIPDRLEMTVAPNPFNSVCKIRISKQKNMNCNISIQDITGRTLKKFLIAPESEKYTIKWNAENIPDGIYFIRCKCGESEITEKAIYIK